MAVTGQAGADEETGGAVKKETGPLGAGEGQETRGPDTYGCTAHTAPWPHIVH